MTAMRCIPRHSGGDDAAPSCSRLRDPALATSRKARRSKQARGANQVVAPMSKVGREFYLANEAYARALEAIEPQAYDKYVDALERAAGREPILDVGCGTGTAVS